ncbi:putative RNA-directed DNA polymerase [Tanacetum coccineum]|uniref:RNA-directed DNA polymerase n=1 Tax=Tanacetum coccineum TaxID=301880 RepID=A0ABQ4WGM7_9ASTR
MVIRSKVRIVKANPKYNLHVTTSFPILKSPFHALRDPNWKQAMCHEYKALIDNNTWVLVPRPPNVNIVRSMWLYKQKYNADESLSRYKACLVANGRSQQQGIDYDEKFSAIVKPATIRIVLSLAVSRQWPIHQLDVKNAFLHGHLTKTVYMHQPPGFTNSAHSDYVCLLQNKTDSSLFIFHKGPNTAYLLLYVDDIILTASSTSLMKRIISSLHAEFAMTYLGLLNYFLGISATRTTSGIFLSQTKYATEILEQAQMLNCNPCRTPVDTEKKLGPEGSPVTDPTLYRSFAGALQYLTFTRPDFSYAVQQLCLYMHDPREPHLNAMKRVLRYLRGTTDLGLQLFRSTTSQLIAYSDADWAGCLATRRSTFGYCVFLGDNLLTWSSKRQDTLSRSSAEAKYRGVANAVAETSWIHNLLRELHTPLFTATSVYCDNVSAVYMSANPVQHQRTKHIEIDIHFVRDKVTVGHVRVLHVPSRFQYAYIFTKGLPYPLFADFRSSLSVCKSPTPIARSIRMSVHGYTDDEYEYESDGDNVTLISKLDVSSPLHLHPNDSATLTVVSVKLKGTENYQVWSCAMLLALEGKNKTGFIDGSCRRSNTDEILGKQWDRVNVVVLGWILNSISEELFLGQIFSKRAKHVCDELKDTYDKVDSSVTFNLHHKINSLSQNGSSDYYHKLNALWKQFDALVQLPRCTCHAAEDFKKHNSLMKLIQFLMGLDDSYMQIRSNILSRDPLPDVRGAYAIISSEESHRVVSSSGVGTSQRSQTSVFNSSVNNRGFTQRPPTSGNSYMPNNVNRPSGNGNRRTSGGPTLVCEHCGFNGHTIDRRFVNNNSAGPSTSSTFSDDQISKLISLIKENSMSNNGNGVSWPICSLFLNMLVSHPNGTEALITKVGNLVLTKFLTLYDVLVVPEYSDLMDVKLMGIGRQVNGLYFFDKLEGNIMHSNMSNSTLFKWHDRLGHPSDQVLEELKHDLYLKNNIDNKSCEICLKAKQTREPFPLSEHKSTALGELVHLDLWGPYKVVSKEGHRYFLTIVDDYSRAVWAYLLKSKEEVFDCVYTFFNLIKNQFHKSVKVFRSDNGTEFLNHKMTKFCGTNGIIHQTSCAYTPQQNGIVERKHRHLLNVARSLLFQGGIPLYLWSECILTACYLINRLPSSVLKGKSPYQLVFNKKPPMKHLRVFGCLCFATVLNNHDKFSSRAEKCVFVGYSSFKKGYKLFSLERRQFIFSRDVKFFEKVFPFKIKQDSVSNTSQDLDHVNFFNGVDHEGPDTSNDEININTKGQSEGSNSPHNSSPTIDQDVDELGHSIGSNGSASEDGIAATS